jgi:hypothetical protein
MTTWTIAIDWDRNGDYIGTYDDVSNRVMSAKWFLGARTPYQQIANDSVFDLEMDNSDKRYSPDNSFSPLYGKLLPQRPVRIQSNDGTTVRTHWTGWLEAVTPAVGKYGKRTVKITATGSMQFFKAAETHLPVQENKRADEIIRDLVDEVLYPYTAGQFAFFELNELTADDPRGKRRVDLDQPVKHDVTVRQLERAIDPRHDADAHRAAQPERAAHRVRLAALANGGRVAEDGGHDVGDRFRGVDDRDVVLGLAGDDLAARLGAIGEGQLDLGRIGDDMQAGQDVALECDHDTAAEPALVGLAGLGRPLGLDQDE